MANKRNAIILAAHGSTAHPQINQPMFELADRIGRNEGLRSTVVTPAFIDGNPDVRNIIDDIEQENVIVIPFMASDGYYSDVVFKKAIVHEKKSIQFASSIGTHPVLPSLIQRRIGLAVKEIGSDDVTVVVVGHGTRKNKNSCRSTIDLVKELRRNIQLSNIEFAFIDQNPAIEHVAERTSTRNVIVIPFLMGLGPHVTNDIPVEFGIGDIKDSVFQKSFEFPCRQNVMQKSGQSQTVFFDAPVGIYPELADVCVSIAKSIFESTRDDNQHHMEVV